MGKVFDELYGDKVLYYKNKSIPVKSLGLESDYLMRFCAAMELQREWVLDGITYKWIRTLRSIGDNKARAIAEALMRHGVEIKDIPEIPEPTRLVFIGTDFIVECTNCHSRLLTRLDVSQQPFRYCPMCGKKLRWEE